MKTKLIFFWLGWLSFVTRYEQMTEHSTLKIRGVKNFFLFKIVYYEVIFTEPNWMFKSLHEKMDAILKQVSKIEQLEKDEQRVNEYLSTTLNGITKCINSFNDKLTTIMAVMFINSPWQKDTTAIKNVVGNLPTTPLNHSEVAKFIDESFATLRDEIHVICEYGELATKLEASRGNLKTAPTKFEDFTKEYPLTSEKAFVMPKKYYDVEEYASLEELKQRLTEETVAATPLTLIKESEQYATDKELKEAEETADLVNLFEKEFGKTTAETPAVETDSVKMKSAEEVTIPSDGSEILRAGAMGTEPTPSLTKPTAKRKKMSL